MAIFSAAWIAIHQAKLQHRSASKLHVAEQNAAKLDIAKTLFVLANNCSSAMRHTTNQLKDRESIHKIAEGLEHCDFNELLRLDSHLNAITLHSLPYSLVTPAMILGSTLRQFNEKTEMTLRLHKQMDSTMFDDFFRTIGEMNASLDATCKDIQSEVNKLEMISE